MKCDIIFNEVTNDIAYDPEYVESLYGNTLKLHADGHYDNGLIIPNDQFVFGKKSNVDGRSIILIHDQHRFDGPAIINRNNIHFWVINGQVVAGLYRDDCGYISFGVFTSWAITNRINIMTPSPEEVVEIKLAWG